MKSIYTLLFAIFFFNLSAQEVQTAVLEGRWFDETIPGSNAYDNAYNEVWGLAINGYEIAIIGSTLGTHFIDVTDPNNPEQIHFVEGGTAGPAIIHRDYHDHNGYLYAVADEGNNSTLQIIDISQLPDAIEVVFDDNALIRRTHNLFIDTTSSILYTGISQGTNNNYSPLRVFDISNPIDPVEIGDFNSFGNFNISQVHDLYVNNNIGYLNCGPGGFAVVDFTDMDNPTALATLTTADYPQSGYNHSGWLSDDATHYYMADETHGMDIKVMDVSNLPDIEITAFIDAGSTDQYSIPHNQIVHENYLYSSYYYDGLIIHDITNKSQPTLAYTFDTSDIDHRNNYEGAWGVYPLLPSGNVLVSDMQEGLFVLSLPEINNNEDIVNEQSVVLVPNPSDGNFIFNMENQVNEPAIIELFSIDGRKIYSQNTTLENSNKINLDVSEGMYIFVINTKTTSYKSKIQIIK